LKPKIRVGVVDDHPLLREGVVYILKGAPDIEVVAQGATAKEAIDIASIPDLDVLVLDISIPGGGLNALQTIMDNNPKVKVLMLTVSADETDVLSALRMGAKGYVLKGVSGPELIQALCSVNLDGQYISPSLGAKLLLDVGRGKTITKGNVFEDLSSRQDEILLLVGQGLSNKEIGAKLHLSDRTIKHHMTNVFQKLGVRNRLEAALLVRQKTQGRDKDLQ
jgi:two-component system, NarL family, nitrate/nitrite response regulator NarL